VISFATYKYGKTTGGSIRQADPLYGEKQNLRCLPGPLIVSALGHCACRWGEGLRHPALVLCTGACPRITAAAHATLEALETRCVHATFAVKCRPQLANILLHTARRKNCCCTGAHTRPHALYICSYGGGPVHLVSRASSVACAAAVIRGRAPVLRTSAGCLNPPPPATRAVTERRDNERAGQTAQVLFLTKKRVGLSDTATCRFSVLVVAKENHNCSSASAGTSWSMRFPDASQGLFSVSRRDSQELPSALRAGKLFQNLRCLGFRDFGFMVWGLVTDPPSVSH